MLLCVDIGNTNITFGIFKGMRLLKVFDIPTDRYAFIKLKRALGRVKVRNSIICSVVPQITGKLAYNLRNLTKTRPQIIGKDIFVPIKNRYRKPKEVGQDRLVNAYAATRLYGTPAIAIDFGTGVTFDIISKKGEYLGGMILPGLKISLEALHMRTALLPNVKLDNPKELIGRDTKNSILSGIVYGYAALTDNLIVKIKNKIGRNAEVIATGGSSVFISRYCRMIKRVCPDLTLKGMMLIHKSEKNS
jgi:type III pantothenate kinase